VEVGRVEGGWVVAVKAEGGWVEVGRVEGGWVVAVKEAAGWARARVAEVERGAWGR
jgi:hypothetical protein